jgi:hypothetical protein
MYSSSGVNLRDEFREPRRTEEFGSNGYDSDLRASGAKFETTPELLNILIGVFLSHSSRILEHCRK